MSWRLQASTVVELVSGLLGSGAGVRPDDIGVMATYRKQVGSTTCGHVHYMYMLLI